MVRRNRARYLAPIALLATITATYLVVHGALIDKSSTAQPQLARSSTLAGKRTPSGKRPPFYVVQSGDTLSNISAKTGVSLPKLESLNPNVNPSALQAGQRLRLQQ